MTGIGRPVVRSLGLQWVEKRQVHNHCATTDDTGIKVSTPIVVDRSKRFRVPGQFVPMGRLRPYKYETLTMAIEIERKFKLKSSTVLEGLKGSYFLQAYLAKGSVLVRVRVADDKAWLTIKGQPVSRPEWEYEIPVADANEMARQPGAYSLEKTRYFIEHHGHMFEVDRYHGGLEGLYSVEVEMDSEKAQITLPDWVGEEVTGNKAWDNESLARNGWPT